MTAIIPVNSEYRIELDQYSWKVSKWKTRKKHPVGGNWEGISWHKTLQQAGESVLKRLLYEDDLSGTQEIIEALHASSKVIARAIMQAHNRDSWLDEHNMNSCVGC
ncbi:MAG: hypothetical protein KZQ98_19780 [Candidatus Thiodiazotropha sp. (ex Lucinoma borealis)]|nr:hypothetical protein [Candidatus Thiodiazotropha sp. (ex Lucinoma borealis)]